MNVHELQRRELSHLESIVAHLEWLRSSGSFGAGSIIYSSEYWRSRVLALCSPNSEADIQERTHRLLECLPTVDRGQSAASSVERAARRRRPKPDALPDEKSPVDKENPRER